MRFKPVFNTKVIFFLLTIISSIIFVWPQLNFQDQLAQGDHGRDLYAFEVVTQGQLPYKDFWWVYGPLMPYYYSLFYKIFGVHISSILLGEAVLLVACTAFFYLACAVLMSPALSWLAAIWFMEFREEFICTYSHIGGTFASLIIIYAIFSYIRLGTMRYLWMSLWSIFFLMLIKVNFGVVSLLAILLGIPLIDRIKQYPWQKEKNIFYGAALILVPLVTGATYWYLLKDLPLYAIRQCMPYFGDDQPYHASPLFSVHAYYQGYSMAFLKSPANTCIGLIFGLAALFALYILIRKKTSEEDVKNLSLSIGMTILFFIFYFHEFLVSNVWYRSFWSYPFVIFFGFLLLAVTFRKLHLILRLLIFIFFLKIMLFGAWDHWKHIQDQKKPDHYLSMPRGEIYVGNEAVWVDTVNRVTDYLNHNLDSNQLFLALPYDCLYYYLTGKPSPTRQLIFFDHIKIPQTQEINVIKDLENKHVNYILMSTRIISPEWGLGIFGRTYCPLLAAYFRDNFTQIYQQGGDPQRPPGWADNHGVFILRRNSEI